MLLGPSQSLRHQLATAPLPPVQKSHIGGLNVLQLGLPLLAAPEIEGAQSFEIEVALNGRSACSARGTLCSPCSYFASTGIIAVDLTHDLKPIRCHSPTSGPLFAVVGLSISCAGSRNEVPMEANKPRDSLDTHGVPLLDKRRNGTYYETEFPGRVEEHGRKERNKVLEDDNKNLSCPALS